MSDRGVDGMLPWPNAGPTHLQLFLRNLYWGMDFVSSSKDLVAFYHILNEYRSSTLFTVLLSAARVISSSHILPISVTNGGNFITVLKEIKHSI